MCGRYVSVKSNADLTAEFDAEDHTDGLWPEGDFNIAPTKPVRVVVNRPLRHEDGSAEEHPTRQLRVVSWGLVPSWAKDRKTQGRMFNARSESVATSNAFTKPYAKRRCLVPADGWYEWQVVDTADGPRKQPLYMTPEDGHPLAFAGLYEFWRGAGEQATLTTCTILTTASRGVLAEVHDRMPLVLASADHARWLDPSVTDPAELLQPRDGAQLELRPVATDVNKVANGGPSLIDRVEPLDEQTLF